MLWLQGLPFETGAAPWLDQGLGLLLKAAVLLLAAWLLTRLLHRASAAARHRIWTLALVGVLALPALALVLPAWHLPGGSTAGASGAGPGPDVPGTLAGPAGETGRLAGPSPATRRPEAPGPEGRTGGWLAASKDAGAWLAGFFPWVWLAGAGLLLTRLLVSSIAAHRLVRGATRITDGTLLAEVAELSDRLKLARPVSLVETDRISMPMATGLLRDWILLPEGVDAWPATKRRAVLLHELAHLERRDCQISLLGRLVTALHWPNPLAWIAVHRLRSERELACDDLVLRSGTPGPDYAQYLLDLARAMRPSATPGWAMVAMARPSELEGRLLSILDPQVERGPGPSWVRLGGVALLAFLLLPLASLQPFPALDTVTLAEEPSLPAPGDETPASAGAAPAAVAGDGSEPGGSSRLIEAFTRALDDGSPSARQQAAHALGRMEDPAAVRPLVDVLGRDGDPRVREQAAWSLGMIESPAAVSALIRALDDGAPEVRQQAAWSLGMIEDPSAAPRLARHLEREKKAPVREQIAWALGMIQDPSAVAVLAAAVRHDGAAEVRAQAAWALGMIQDRAGLDSLIDAVADGDPNVREQALWAVGRIAG